MYFQWEDVVINRQECYMNKYKKLTANNKCVYGIYGSV